MKKLLLIHQGAELYGSDRSLLNIIDALKEEYQLEIWLPQKGKLFEEIRKRNIDIKILELSVLRLIEFKKLNFKAFYNFLRHYFSFKGKFEEYDLVLFNTLVCIDYMIPVNTKKIIVVREIKNNFISAIFSKLITLSRSNVIFNSFETSRYYNKLNGHVLDNTVDDLYSRLESKRASTDQNFNKILYIGRLTEWKGVHVLIDALKIIKRKGYNFQLSIVGDIYPGNEGYLEFLKSKVEQFGLTESVSFLGFISDTSSVYLEHDIIAVPSIEPEPFGRIAVEAMMFKKLPIVANHGGLKDIVQHQENGLKFMPGSAKDLASKIMNVLEGDIDYKSMTESGRKTYLKQYHPDVFGTKLKTIINSYLNN